MQYTDPLFALFLPAAFALYWAASRGGRRWQQAALLTASCCFYACWNWQLLFLLLLNGGVNFFAARKMAAARSRRSGNAWYALALVWGLGTLVLFKYTGFFVDSFGSVANAFGGHPDLPTLRIVLPLGISFYTLQNLGYVLDVRRGRTEATSDLLAFLCYATFFPTIVSGPIERSTGLLAQLGERRQFDGALAREGLRQILWGLFKKIVVAGNLARVVDPLFAQPAAASGAELLLGILLFTFQLYADFSGYSGIAIGTGKLLGFRLMRNFNHPFFATSIPAYWRRWHISLTSWLTDYVFTPLAIRLRDLGRAGIMIAILATYIAVGFWHAGRWTFVAFGLLHSLYFLRPVMSGALYKREKAVAATGLLPARKLLLRMLATFLLVALAEVLFRADSLGAAAQYLRQAFARLAIRPSDPAAYGLPGLAVVLMMGTEWLQYRGAFRLPENPALRWAGYLAMVWIIYLFGASQEFFIYSRF